MSSTCRPWVRLGVTVACLGGGCSTAGMVRAPSSLRDYEYLIVGSDSLDQAFAAALKEAHLTVRRQVRGGETPTLVVLHFHEAAEGSGYLVLQLTDTRRVGVVGESRIALDSIDGGAAVHARALLDSLGIRAH